jgi:DNA-binding LacI/PurR family transcriptional regulator
MPKNPTLHDVARLAGVSYQTVSRVINGERYVAAETLERVQKAIAELNYRPNRAARSLITHESGAIQIIVFDFGSLFSIHSIFDTAQKHACGTFISVLEKRHSVNELHRLIDESVSRQMDGILLMMPWIDVSFEELQHFAQGKPLVVVGADLGEQSASVFIDQKLGAQMAFEHLFSLGHRRFGEITGNIEVYYDAQMRHQTTLQEIRERGAHVTSAAGNFLSPGGYRAACELLEQDPGITALICANDQMAFGAIRALLDRGLRIPQDISVIGFDDLPIAAFYEPPLTTIRQDFNALGRLGMESLLELIKKPDTPASRKMIPPELVIRKSTGVIIQS